MTLGITFLLVLLPLIGIFIASNFAVVSGYLQNALAYVMDVPAIAGSLWGLLPGGVTGFITALFVLSLSVALISRIIGGRF